MTRSPLAYPLVRGVDADIGGASDLQTDVMRFMAILALCLVAIFALVQSLPLAPEPDPAEAPETAPVAAAAADIRQPAVSQAPAAAAPRPPAASTSREPIVQAPAQPERAAETTVADEQIPAAAPPVTEGFTLRFESDLALTRLVAAGEVGFYAMTPGRAQRMSVRASRVSFWDASQPARFHEMERATVPKAVLDALQRTGVDTADAGLGVTLPGRLSEELESIMREHRGGALVIGADGTLRREAP